MYIKDPKSYSVLIKLKSNCSRTCNSTQYIHNLQMEETKVQKNNKTPEQLAGAELELLIHQGLENLQVFDECLFGDADIVKFFSRCKLVNGIDHYCKCGNFVVLIQDKWEKTSPKLRDINHFIRATEILMTKFNDCTFLCLFVSKMPMNKTGLDNFTDANKKYPHNVYFNIDFKNRMEGLVGLTIEKITSELYSRGLYNSPQSKKIILRPHQVEAVTSFETNILNTEGLKSGVFCLPTGSGKTFISLACVGKFMQAYPTKSVLWITQRKDVMQSQFDGSQIKVAVNSGLIPGTTEYNLLKWYNRRNDIEALNAFLEQDKPTFLITNVDSLIWKKRNGSDIEEEKYKRINPDKFGLIILDECHSASAQCTFDMLTYAMKQWTSLKALVGFSATPVRPAQKKFKKSATLFGSDGDVNFLYRMSLVDAIDSGIVVPPKFYWVETKLDKKVSHTDFQQNINGDVYGDMLNHVEAVFYQSYSKKGIAWTQTIENANMWFNIIQYAQQFPVKYPTLSKLNLYISHTGKIDNPNSENTNGLKDFMLWTGPALLICVGRCKEGFDDPAVDVGINLDPVQSRGMIVYMQQTGRVIRQYKDKKTGIMMDTFTFIEEDKKMEEICNIIVGYALFLKQLDIGVNNFDVSKEFNDLVKNLVADPKTKKVYLKTPGGKNIEFNVVSTVLKSLDWNNIPTLLRQKIEEKFYNNGIGYETAKSIIRKHCDENGKILSKEEYYRLCEIEPRLPVDPETKFTGKFNWIDYLGIECKYYDIVQCKDKIKEYFSVDSTRYKIFDLDGICKLLCETDNMFPPYGLWVEYYNVNDLATIIPAIPKSPQKQKLVFI